MSVPLKIFHGITKKDGIAIATAAVVDAENGINGVSTTLLNDGIVAIRRMLDREDYPEAVIVCDFASTGAFVRLPGINVIGIAAQSDEFPQGFDPEVPCVIGLTDLMQSISDGDILIIDGNKGVVHIDPDPQTIIHYQQIEDRHLAKPPVYLESEHIPARTQSGEIVNVYALVDSETDLMNALHEGADGLLVELPDRCAFEYYEEVLTAAAGKPIMFATDFVDIELFRAVMKMATPLQVSVVFPQAMLESLKIEAQTVLDNLAVEAYLNDLDLPQVSFGVIVSTSEPHDNNGALSVTDIRETPHFDESVKDGELVVLGSRIDMLEPLFNAGARRIVVNPDVVSQCKYAIRLIGEEEVD